MQKLVRVAAVLYVVYAAFVLFFLSMEIIDVTSTIESSGCESETQLPHLIPMTDFVFKGLFAVFVIGLLAYFLYKQSHRNLCLVLSAMLLIGFPVGTVLGIFTIFLLTQASVKKQFSN